MTRRTYLTGEEGRAAYQAQAVRDATPRGDPQRTAGWQDPRERVALTRRECPACWHPAIVHELGRAGVRGACTIIEDGAPCRCIRFGGPHRFGDDLHGRCRGPCGRPFLDAGPECKP